MTAEEVQLRVDLLNEMVDNEILPLLKDRTDGICAFTEDTEELKKIHSAFVKGREQLFSELHLLGHDVITVPLMIGSSVWDDYGVKHIDGASHVDGAEGKQWKHWWGRRDDEEAENAQVHVYERIGPNFPPPPRAGNRFFTLLFFSERWDAKNGRLEDLYRALNALAMRFFVIDSELSRRLNAEKEKSSALFT